MSMNQHFYWQLVSSKLSKIDEPLQKGKAASVCPSAGMAFYSISDIADRLLSTTAHPIPSLEEGYWLGRCPPDHPHQPLVQALLEELSPPAMAAFDLACCHCTLWKTSRQLLDTAERRLNVSLETRGELWGGGLFMVVVCRCGSFHCAGLPTFFLSLLVKMASANGIVSNPSSL